MWKVGVKRKNSAKAGSSIPTKRLKHDNFFALAANHFVYDWNVMNQDNHRLGAYAPPPDNYDSYDRHDFDQGHRGWLFLGAAAIAVALFIVVIYNTFLLGVRERDESPLITADAQPYRVAPEDPGGYEAPDQDLSVHDLRLSGSGQAQTHASPGEPKSVREEPVLDDMPSLRVETADADQLGSAEIQRIEPEPTPVDDTLDRAIANVLSDQAEPDFESEPAMPERDLAPQRVPDRRPDPTPEPVSEETSPGSSYTLPPVSAGTTGVFLAQIAAFRSEEDALKAWREFSVAMPDLVLGYTPDVQRADLGERGIFYRLRVASFENRDDAASFCEILKSRDRACLVARR